MGSFIAFVCDFYFKFPCAHFPIVFEKWIWILFMVFNVSSTGIYYYILCKIFPRYFCFSFDKSSRVSVLLNRFCLGGENVCNILQASETQNKTHVRNYISCILSAGGIYPPRYLTPVICLEDVIENVMHSGRFPKLFGNKADMFFHVILQSHIPEYICLENCRF
jgi:hypothetical protein